MNEENTANKAVWFIDTKERFPYCSNCGYVPEYMTARCLSCGADMTAASPKYKAHSEFGTLCWKCKHAVPRKTKAGRYICGCSWSMYKRPVKGWTAKEGTIIIKNREECREVSSYEVIRCPEYEHG